MLAHKLQDLRARRAAGETGFTLVELLVVVVIIVALAAIAVPIFLSQKDKADLGRLDSDINAVGKILAAGASTSERVIVDGRKISVGGAAGTQEVDIQSGVTVDGDTAKFPKTLLSGETGIPVIGDCIDLEIGGEFRSYTVGTGVADVACAP